MLVGIIRESGHFMCHVQAMHIVKTIKINKRNYEEKTRITIIIKRLKITFQHHLIKSLRIKVISDEKQMSYWHFSNYNQFKIGFSGFFFIVFYKHAPSIAKLNTHKKLQKKNQVKINVLKTQLFLSFD